VRYCSIIKTEDIPVSDRKQHLADMIHTVIAEALQGKVT
jgi:hypothetical protein